MNFKIEILIESFVLAVSLFVILNVLPIALNLANTIPEFYKIFGAVEKFEKLTVINFVMIVDLFLLFILYIFFNLAYGSIKALIKLIRENVVIQKKKGKDANGNPRTHKHL
jgi:hypothetical protein